MKSMQDFHNWLSATESLLPDQHCFANLTRVCRVRFIEISSTGPWWVWGAEQTQQTVVE